MCFIKPFNNKDKVSLFLDVVLLYIIYMCITLHHVNFCELINFIVSHEYMTLFQLLLNRLPCRLKAIVTYHNQLHEDIKPKIIIAKDFDNY